MSVLARATLGAYFAVLDLKMMMGTSHVDVIMPDGFKIRSVAGRQGPGEGGCNRNACGGDPLFAKIVGDRGRATRAV